MMIIGLTDLNVQALQAGRPIAFPGNDIGFNGEVIIMLGRDDAELQRMLTPTVGKDGMVLDLASNRK